MPEDAGKKRFIQDFLKNVQSGIGFTDDIRIERMVREPGSDGDGSTAISLSGRKISNITELLEDDLRHTFDEGYFTFRFIAALVGSGKTSLLTYLKQLTETKPTYENHSVVIDFLLSDIPRSYSIKFMDSLYSHILANTFYQLLHNVNLPVLVRNTAEIILSAYLKDDHVIKLKSINQLDPFCNIFNQYIKDNFYSSLETLFFEVVSRISEIDRQFSFVYLIDELDALEQFEEEIKETRLLLKQLIRRASTNFNSKIRILMYIVGTSNNVNSFIVGDSVINSLIGNLVVNLDKGSEKEFSLIKEKINERIKGAYKGYKGFIDAWQEIQNIKLSQTNTLREFCQRYASEVLKIHNKYFSEAPEQTFEGNARELVESKCKQKWANYLTKAGYKLSTFYTTKVIENHAFDCYVELLHNGNAVARAFGEAKNYGLLTEHLIIFDQWLKDVRFNPLTSGGNLGDIAFMIAPSCSLLLQRKLELKNIEFIQSDKIEPIEIIDRTQKEDLTKLTVPQLKKRASNASIKGYSKMRKAELIEALSSN